MEEEVRPLPKPELQERNWQFDDTEIPDPVPANLQDEKSVSFSENGDYEVLPDDGYDAVKKVNVDVNTYVPNVLNEASGSVDASQIGQEIVFETPAPYDSMLKQKVLVDITVEPVKQVSITQNGTSQIRPSTGNDFMEGTDINVNVPETRVEARRAVTITQNGTQNVSPASGFDALQGVDITTTVPTSRVQPVQNLTITGNGSRQIRPNAGYDGLAGVNLTINVPVDGLLVNGGSDGYYNPDVDVEQGDILYVSNVMTYNTSSSAAPGLQGTQYNFVTAGSNLFGMATNTDTETVYSFLYRQYVSNKYVNTPVDGFSADAILSSPILAINSTSTRIAVKVATNRVLVIDRTLVGGLPVFNRDSPSSDITTDYEVVSLEFSVDLATTPDTLVIATKNTVETYVNTSGLYVFKQKIDFSGEVVRVRISKIPTYILSGRSHKLMFVIFKDPVDPTEPLAYERKLNIYSLDTLELRDDSIRLGGAGVGDVCLDLSNEADYNRYMYVVPFQSADNVSVYRVRVNSPGGTYPTGKAVFSHYVNIVSPNGGQGNNISLTPFSGQGGGVFVFNSYKITLVSRLNDVHMRVYFFSINNTGVAQYTYAGAVEQNGSGILISGSLSTLNWFSNGSIYSKTKPNIPLSTIAIVKASGVAGSRVPCRIIPVSFS